MLTEHKTYLSYLPKQLYFTTFILLSAYTASEYKRENLYCVISALPPPSQVYRGGERRDGIIIYSSSDLLVA